MTTTDWIAADWGLSNLRLWLMRDSEVIEMASSDRGVSTLLVPEDFAAELTRMTEAWPALPIIACGMVGARQGWVETPCRTAPCPAVPTLTPAPAAPGGRPVLIAGGVTQISPPDLMHGAETRIAGVLAAQPDFDGVICLPGTLTKWVRVSAGEICHFQTIMTGEIFSLLARQSVLRFSLSEDAANPHSNAFREAVATALSRPHVAWGKLYQLRAAALIGPEEPDLAAARLLGTLIGLDLGAARPHWLGQKVLILGTPRLAALYEAALREQGVQPIPGDADAATRAGLWAAWQQHPGAAG